MLWLTWRQHRHQVLVTAALLSALAAFFVVTRLQMAADLQHSTLGSCLAQHGDCNLLSQDFRASYGGLLTFVTYLQLAPMLAGLFLGAPLIGRELEHGTHRLAWTQSIGIGRWLAVKLAFLSCLVAGAACVIAVLASWWFQPFNQVQGLSRVQLDEFSLQGLAPVAYAMFAFALGTAAGALLHRTLPAMAVTLAGYLAARISFDDLRSRLLAPERLSYPVGQTSPRAGRGDWILQNSGWSDPHGRALSGADIQHLCGRSLQPGFGPCLTGHHIQRLDLYQPLHRFWALQGIEAGIYLALTTALLALAAYWTLRRIA